MICKAQKVVTVPSDERISEMIAHLNRQFKKPMSKRKVDLLRMFIKKHPNAFYQVIDNKLYYTEL